MSEGDVMTDILLDLDGVLYQNGRPIKGAAQTILWLKKQKIPHLFVTNTSSKPRTAILDKLATFGIKTETKYILTPPIAALGWLKSHFKKPTLTLYLNEASKKDFSGFQLAESDSDHVDAIIIGDMGRDWSFDQINAAFQQLMHSPSAQLIALGLTRYWQTSNGLQLDVGPFVKALEYATGREAVVCGKPSASFFETAACQLQLNANQLIMIGDDIQGDIGGAQKAGLKALQVRTGKFRVTDLQQGVKPDDIINSIANLPQWWNQHIDRNT
jgi:phospholysine phosphohistidine inorganic pyrophosphate phosphatase